MPTALPKPSRPRLNALAAAALPWLMVLLGFLVVATYVPGLSLWLPNLLFGVSRG